MSDIEKVAFDDMPQMSNEEFIDDIKMMHNEDDIGDDDKEYIEFIAHLCRKGYVDVKKLSSQKMKAVIDGDEHLEKMIDSEMRWLNDHQ